MPVDQILGCFKTLVEEIQFRGQPVKLILNKFKIRDCGEKKIKVTFKRHGTKNLTGHLFSERNSYFRFVHTELTNRVKFQLFLGTRTVLVVLVRVALSSGTGNGDLWDKPLQLEFSLVDHLSMSSRTRSQKVNKDGRKDSAERVFKLLLNVVNQILCS